MTNHVCIDCQDDCAVCISRANHPAGKGNSNLRQLLKTGTSDVPGDGMAYTDLEHDPVNNPSHYTSDPSGVECIQITRHRSFNIGNAIKYLWRAGLKNSDATVQDLEKAIFYIKDEINRLGGAK